MHALINPGLVLILDEVGAINPAVTWTVDRRYGGTVEFIDGHGDVSVM